MIVKNDFVTALYLFLIFFAVTALSSGAYFNEQANGAGRILVGAQSVNEFGNNRLGGQFNAGFNSFNEGYSGQNGGLSDPIADLENAIPGGGVPGEDYPILAFVPETGFTCTGLIPGYYADTNLESQCQVFHICQDDGRQDSFLCPNGTLFNQQYFVCDWWFNVDCSSAAQFYGLNSEIGKVPQGLGINGLEYESNILGDTRLGLERGSVRGETLALANGGGGLSSQNLGRQSIETPSSYYGVPSNENRIASNRVNTLAPSTSYGTPSIGTGNQNRRIGSRRGGRQRNGNVSGAGSSRRAIQAPSSLYQTPGR